MKAVTGVLGLIYKLYIGILFTCTLLVFYLPILVCLSKESWKKRSFPFFVAWSYIVRILGLIWVHRCSRATLPEGPYMIIANHASYFDIFLMYSILPKHRFLFLGKSEILSYPLIKTFFKRLNIPVYRNDRMKAGKAFVQARREIVNGWSLVVFPEGGIPDITPQMLPFKIGAFKLAKGAGIPIVPLTFVDNWHLFSDPGDVLGPAHPGVSRVYVHPVITSAEVSASTEEELLERTYELIAAPLIVRGMMKPDEKAAG
jgi:1-acyl-sn-glycerol-3-phosphate acyltransferase